MGHGQPRSQGATSSKRSRVFRQVALDRLSSPERLDTLMQVLRPAGWLALLAVAVVLVVAVAWGFLGSIPIRVSGEGVLLPAGGIDLVVSEASGSVLDVAVEVGDTVAAGQVVATLAQPDIEHELDDARLLLAQLENAARRDAPLTLQATDLSQRALQSRRDAAAANLATLRAEVERLRRKEEAQQKLVAEGVVTEDTLAEARLDVEQARSKVIEGEAEVERLDSEIAKARLQQGSSQEDRQRKVEDARHKVEELEGRLGRLQEVVAPMGGLVMEVLTATGELLQPGSPVVSIEREHGKGLELIAYVSALDAYEVSKGMEVQIVPSVVKKEEYGSLLGRVLSVAEVPAAREDLMRVLGNEPLAERLSQVGLPVQVRAELVADDSTPSGYRWTSSRGAPLRLHHGTLCSLSVVVRERAPITLAIPGLEEVLGR